MIKTIGFILLVIALSIMFISPLRNFMNNLVYGDKSDLIEEQMIGMVSGHNPRIREIQHILKDANFNPGRIDGMMGQQTRKAIAEFQKEKGLKPTGKIDSPTQLALEKEKEILKQAPKIQPSPDLSLHQTPPASSNAQNPKVKTEDKKNKAEIQDEIMSYRLKSKDRTKQIQTALKKEGFYKGEVDGKFGPQTIRAIKAFQKAKGLTPDGIVGSKTWEKLEKCLKTK
ncbi:MAG: peptidoglycan-binding protein [Candidatus Omnitrophota bacterium]